LRLHSVVSWPPHHPDVRSGSQRAASGRPAGGQRAASGRSSRKSEARFMDITCVGVGSDGNLVCLRVRSKKVTLAVKTFDAVKKRSNLNKISSID